MQKKRKLGADWGVAALRCGDVPVFGRPVYGWQRGTKRSAGLCGNHYSHDVSIFCFFAYAAFGRGGKVAELAAASADSSDGNCFAQSCQRYFMRLDGRLCGRGSSGRPAVPIGRNYQAGRCAAAGSGNGFRARRLWRRAWVGVFWAA